MIGGFLLALTVACAEIYFLFKHLNSMDTLDAEKLAQKRKKPIKSTVRGEVIAEPAKPSIQKKKD
jgi:hypothetical protein